MTLYSNTSEYQRRRAFILIIKEAGRKSVQLLPDFGSYSTECSVIIEVRVEEAVERISTCKLQRVEDELYLLISF